MDTFCNVLMFCSEKNAIRGLPLSLADSMHSMDCLFS